MLFRIFRRQVRAIMDLICQHRLQCLYAGFLLLKFSFPFWLLLPLSGSLFLISQIMLLFMCVWGVGETETEKEGWRGVSGWDLAPCFSAYVSLLSSRGHNCCTYYTPDYALHLTTFRKDKFPTLFTSRTFPWNLLSTKMS